MTTAHIPGFSWRGISALLVLAGCTGADGPAAGVVIDTVAGVPRITSTAGTWAADEAWRIAAEQARIGGVDGPEETSFGDISGMAVAEDRIYVADGQSKEIRVFDRRGAFLHRFGRSGEGPGEFVAVDALALAPDRSLLARDPRLLRVTRFGPEGEVRATFPIRRPYIQFSDGRGLWVTDAGTVADRVMLSSVAGAPDSLVLLGYRPDGTPTDTILLHAAYTRNVLVRADGVTRMSFALPFAPRGAAAVAPDGRIARGFGDRYELEVLGPADTPLHRIARAVQPRAADAAERAAVIDALEERARELVPGGRLDDFDLPDTKPAFTHIMADGEGNWWIGAADGWPGATEPSAWDVFDAAGRFLGTVPMPEPMRVIAIGQDWIAGVVRDELDVQYAVVREIVKP